MKKIHCAICWKKIENLKTVKYYTFRKKQFLLLFAVSVILKMKNYLKKKKSVEVLKILGLIRSIYLL